MAELEAEHSKGATSVDLSINFDIPYTIDFTKQVQTRNNTGKRRTIRRVPPFGATQGKYMYMHYIILLHKVKYDLITTVCLVPVTNKEQ